MEATRNTRKISIIIDPKDCPLIEDDTAVLFSGNPGDRNPVFIKLTNQSLRKEKISERLRRKLEAKNNK